MFSLTITYAKLPYKITSKSTGVKWRTKKCQRLKIHSMDKIA